MKKLFVHVIAVALLVGALASLPASARIDGMPPQQVRVLCNFTTTVSHTGDTNETAMRTCTLPAGALGLNGTVRIYARFSNNNSGNNKTGRIRWNGIGGTTCDGGTQTTNLSWYRFVEITNRNSASAQVCGNSGGQAGWGPSTGGFVTDTVNTSAAVDIVATCALANGADTCSVDALMVELIVP